MSDRWAVALALCTAVGAAAAAPGWLGAAPLLVGLACAALALVVRWPALLCAGAALLACGLAVRAEAGLDPPRAAPFSATVTMLTDPEWVLGAVRAEVRIAGRRYEGWARGPAAWRLERRLAGERVELEGTLRPLPPDAVVRLGRRHVVGRLSITAVGGSTAGALPARVANGLRRTLADGAQALPADRRALFTGIVIGDDRGQPVDVADDFRAAGLTHLLAVSGQNVAFVLAVCAPLLRRLGLRSRFVAVLGVIALFGLVTRWEPSVMRAAAMAAVATSAATLGREASGLRRLSLAVTVVLLVDPFLVWSVGFQLSVGASAGILLLAPRIERALPGPRWLAAAAAVTAAAQVGVAPVLVPAFGGLPVATLPANLLAAPAAGPLMMWGLTGGLLAGLAGGWVAQLLHLPTRLLLWWLAGVARWAGSLPLGDLGAGHAAALVGLGLVGVLAARRRPDRPVVRWVTAAAVAVVVAPAFAPVLAPVSPVRAGDEVTAGARLWRHGGASVLVVAGASPARLLEALRVARVGSIDVLVVERPGPAAADAIRPVVGRFRPRLVLAPVDHQLRGAVTPQPGLVMELGGLRITVVEVTPRLAVEVAPARGPPAGSDRGPVYVRLHAAAPRRAHP